LNTKSTTMMMMMMMMKTRSSGVERKKRSVVRRSSNYTGALKLLLLCLSVTLSHAWKCTCSYKSQNSQMLVTMTCNHIYCIQCCEKITSKKNRFCGECGEEITAEDEAKLRTFRFEAARRAYRNAQSSSGRARQSTTSRTQSESHSVKQSATTKSSRKPGPEKVKFRNLKRWWKFAASVIYQKKTKVETRTWCTG